MNNKKFNCFIIERMDIQDTANMMLQGKEVFVKANSLSAMNMNAGKEIELNQAVAKQDEIKMIGV
jgi:hypothetical protein